MSLSTSSFHCDNLRSLEATVVASVHYDSLGLVDFPQ